MAVMIDPWAIYESPQVGWDPHKSQTDVLESNARHKLLCAGRRTGKSDLGGKRFLPEIMFTKSIGPSWLKKGKQRIFWIVGDEYVTADKEFRIIWNLVKQLGIPMDTGSHHSIDGKSQGVLSLWDSAFLLMTQSAKYPDNLVGEALCGVEMVEAAKTKPSIWMKYIRPMLNDYQGWSLHTSTPEGKNHFYDKFEMGQDPDNPNWASWRMPSWRNPYVYTHTGRLIARGLSDLTVDQIPAHEFTKDRDVFFLLHQMEERPGYSAAGIAREFGIRLDEEILAQADELTPELFKQEICADFTEYVGQVFKDYDEEYHVGSLRFNPGWETYAAVDYGYTNPNVWLLIQVGPWGEINVLDEVYKEGMTADQFAEEIKRRGLNPPGLRVMYPDPASPADSQVLSEKLCVQIGTGTGGEIKDRVNMIRQALRRGRIDRDGTGLSETNCDKWRPQLMFDRKCVRTRADMLAYRYPEKKEDVQTSLEKFENPLKQDDHGPEALGRFFAGRAGSLLQPTYRNSTVTKARLGRNAKSSGKTSTARGQGRKPISAMRPTESGYGTWKDEEFRNDYR